MDKIGILTFHRSENYGSVLQAWALCQQINTLPDCQAELIDYSNRAQQDLYALFLPPKSATPPACAAPLLPNLPI